MTRLNINVDEHLKEQGLSPEQIERAKRLLAETSLNPAEAAFAVALADGKTEGDVLRDGVERTSAA